MNKTRETRLRSKAHQAFKEAFPDRKIYRLDRYHIWFWMMSTDCGRRPLPKEVYDLGRWLLGHDPFKDNPWARRLANLKPNQHCPRILVTGMKGVWPNSVLDLEEKIKNRHGWKRITLTFNRDIAYFWEKFYGANAFFTQEAKDVPTLIIMGSKGQMKNYPREGGEWLQVDDRLKEIADFYKIPIEMFESYQS